jgi:hypothetical protein
MSDGTTAGLGPAAPEQGRMSHDPEGPPVLARSESEGQPSP